jgi:fluoride exporter
MSIHPTLHLTLIATGGAAGAVARHLVHQFVDSRWDDPFPLATLSVNIIGCLGIGLVLARLPTLDGLALPVLSFLVTGVLGGFTTFSTFAMDAVRLLEAHQPVRAFLYVSVSNAVGVAAALVGYRAGG